MNRLFAGRIDETHNKQRWDRPKRPKEIKPLSRSQHPFLALFFLFVV
jgi:hypothetical protein